MTTSTLLLVDDEPNNRSSIIRMFEDYDLEFVEAENGQEALDVIRAQKPDLILLDIKMPVMDGFEFLSRYSDIGLKPTPPVCVMTAFNDSDTRRKSIYLGADDFINKPLDPIELETRVASLLRISHYQQDLNSFNRQLEEMVTERTKQLQTTYEKLKETEKQNSRAYREMISRISKLACYNNVVPRPEPRKLGLCAAALGWVCGLPSEEAENLSLSAQVYNIGMLALPEKLREAPVETLNNDQMKILSSYTTLGSDLFKSASSGLLHQAYNICLDHREHYDGTGYPRRLRGNAISLEARLFAVALLIVETLDKFPEGSVAIVENTLRDHSGTLLDPEIVAHLLNSPDTFKELLEQLN